VTPRPPPRRAQPAQEAPKEAPKKEEKKADPEAEAKKAREKLLAKIIKEGGKKGVEIEGASDMGGLDFFCTTMELPDGDMELLQMSMTAMNAMPEEGAEDRKGCSGHVGKMIFSAGVKQLACVAYVPGKDNKSASKVPVMEWAESVAKAVGGKVTKGPTAAESPNGGETAEITVLADPDKGKFPLKDKGAPRGPRPRCSPCALTPPSVRVVVPCRSCRAAADVPSSRLRPV